MSLHKYLPDPSAKSLDALVVDIDRGMTKIPQFQRDFVWTKQKSADLLDSILKCYPIGTFIYWETKAELRSVRNIGGLVLPDTPKGKFVQYVLDGQQRLTSLYAAVKGAKIDRDGEEEDFSEFWVDLEASADEPIVVPNREDGAPEYRYIQLSTLLYGKLKDYKAYSDEAGEVIQSYRDRLNGYKFPVITMTEAPIEVATEVFTRLNVSGKELSLFEIMVAKTYDSAKGFDLAERYDDLIDELAGAQYGTLPSSAVLQCVAACLTKETSKKAILGIEKKKFVGIWDDVESAIKCAVDYLRGTVGVPVSQLLPYPSMMVPFAYFFFKSGGKSPSNPTSSLLVDFFWRAGLGERYSHSADTRLAQDIKKIETILRGKQPKYDWDVDTSVDYIKSNGYFATGRAYIKTILGLLASKGPLSFHNNGKVNVSNDWLKQANSKNYHHFFPRGFMKDKEDSWWVNHIVNITLVDEHLNKGKIRAKAPSKYIAEFEKANPDIAKALSSHFIGLESFGIRDDNYDVFFEKRCARLSKALEAKIVPTNAGSSKPPGG